LRVGIVRGRSCASVLFVPRRKTNLVRALHGMAARAGVGVPWLIMGELAREGREREGEGARWGAAEGATGACHDVLQEGSSTRGSSVRSVLWLLA
jgi:hypothetical protein